ncbi:hypothetical protein BDV95DRAFT_638771 [Massariosphaeria phaeospora]|uniref:Uncharacterized protein n=1 Tax=Massariosphaeria phaeospora TaxID=100035 RepID=A0A7C8I8I7_9PLEO|nr:hypothetical protein BDV95DRAFT_638771 [Massariosphaeria phaeospora]
MRLEPPHKAAELWLHRRALLVTELRREQVVTRVLSTGNGSGGICTRGKRFLPSTAYGVLLRQRELQWRDNDTCAYEWVPVDVISIV